MGVRATLIPRSYLLVNAAIRMNTNGQENFGNVIYGKQSLIDAGARYWRGNDALTEAVGASKHRTVDRRRGWIIEEPLALLDGAAEPQAGLGKTFVNDRQQRSRRERLAQAARGAEFERHAQEVRRRRIEVGKGVSRHRDQRNRWRALVEYPDRFEAPHVRHEDVNEHQVKAGVFQRTKPGFAAISYCHVETVPLKIELDGRADHGIVVDNENAGHLSPLETGIYFQLMIPPSQS